MFENVNLNIIDLMFFITYAAGLITGILIGISK